MQDGATAKLSTGSHKSDPAGRIVYLDALRGLAALAIAAFWHYQTLGAPYQPQGVPFQQAPLYDAPVIHKLYRYGYLAVDLFFMISGLVFHRVYGRAISTRAISARRFFSLRFSRLYPLHALTLCIAAALVWWFHSLTGRIPIS